MKGEKLIIGRRERADFPDIGLMNVDVKTDTGAYTSSIHVTQCEVKRVNDKEILEVVFLDEDHPSYTGQVIRFEDFRQKKVKSSTGHEQMRYFVRLKILLLGRKIRTDFSLTKRNGMKYPILFPKDQKVEIQQPHQTLYIYRLMNLI
jgi:hypothetical protein